MELSVSDLKWFQGGLIASSAALVVLLLIFLVSGQMAVAIQLPAIACVMLGCLLTVNQKSYYPRAFRLALPIAYLLNSLYCLRLDFGDLSIITRLVLSLVSITNAWQLAKELDLVEFVPPWGLRQEKEIIYVNEESSEDLADPSAETIRDYLHVPPVVLALGQELEELQDWLKERVSTVRGHLALELGIVMPPVEIKLDPWEDIGKPSHEYKITLREMPVARGGVEPRRLLAVGPEDKLRVIKGDFTVEPTYGMPACWVTSEERGDAERAGLMIFNPVDVIMTHLTQVMKQHAADLLGRQEVSDNLKKLAETHPALVADLIPERLSLGELRQVLRNLLKEHVSIRDLVAILESLADNVGRTRDEEELTEAVRVALAGNICREYANSEGVIRAFTLSSKLTDKLRAGLWRTDDGSHLDSAQEDGFLAPLVKAFQDMRSRGLQPIVVCATNLRRPLRRLTERSLPTLVVLSTDEIIPTVKLEPVVVLG